MNVCIHKTHCSVETRCSVLSLKSSSPGFCCSWQRRKRSEIWWHQVPCLYCLGKETGHVPGIPVCTAGPLDNVKWLHFELVACCCSRSQLVCAAGLLETTIVGCGSGASGHRHCRLQVGIRFIVDGQVIAQRYDVAEALGIPNGVVCDQFA